MSTAPTAPAPQPAEALFYCYVAQAGASIAGYMAQGQVNRLYEAVQTSGRAVGVWLVADGRTTGLVLNPVRGAVTVHFETPGAVPLDAGGNLLDPQAVAQGQIAAASWVEPARLTEAQLPRLQVEDVGWTDPLLLEGRMTRSAVKELGETMGNLGASVAAGLGALRAPPSAPPEVSAEGPARPPRPPRPGKKVEEPEAPEAPEST